jgi:hypothetical protein
MKPDASILRFTDYSLSPHEIEQRIRQLHADGLKPRDISSLLGVHPQIVLRVIGAAR